MENLIFDFLKIAPRPYRERFISVLGGISGKDLAFVRDSIPATSNPQLQLLIANILSAAAGNKSWEALAFAIKVAGNIFDSNNIDDSVHIAWTGPVSPKNDFPRIEQALYDMVSSAKNNITLVTFAASRIQELKKLLSAAIARGVSVRLILEFEQASGGQLSYDAVKAFKGIDPAKLKIYLWPIEKRENNESGRPGKLHAKAAVADDMVLISSANLTQDALNRNMELGVVIHNQPLAQKLLKHFDSLIEAGMLKRF